MSQESETNAELKNEELSNGKQFIGEVINKKFRIPRFQRGYRWSEENVKKLLEDIYEGRLFQGKNESEWNNSEEASSEFWNITFNVASDSKVPKEPYCIQPLVVVEQKSQDKSYYDVIDGQQRLTTIIIIRAALKAVGATCVEKVSLEYESRSESKEYIEKFYAGTPEVDETNIKDMNIDFAFMKKAYEIAKEFYKEKLEQVKTEDEEIKVCYANYLDAVLCKNTQFIWYRVEPDKPEDIQKIFSHFNTGKMELTNSELIKALFMDPSNYNAHNVKDKQIVISEKWDEIENKLQEPEFWAFIPHPNQYDEPKDEKYSTRIDIIFEYLVMEIWLEKNVDKGIDNYIDYKNKNSSDKYIFNEIERWLKDELDKITEGESKEKSKEESKEKSKEKVMDQCWRKVNRIYSRIKELYSADNKDYNTAGLYINLKNRIEGKVDEYTEDCDTYIKVYYELKKVLEQDRKCREKKFKSLIKELVFGDKEIKLFIKNTRYKGDDSSKIIKILIVYNIAILNQSGGIGERFNFLQNAKNEWQREHIFASSTVEQRKGDESNHRIDDMRKEALLILKGDSYIKYSEELFPTNEIEQSEISKRAEEAKKRAEEAKKRAEELLEYYEIIDKLKEIENADKEDGQQEDLAYSYFKNLQRQKKDILDKKELLKETQERIRECINLKAKKEENGEYSIGVKELAFTYSYKNEELNTKGDVKWEEWLNLEQENDPKKTNYDTVYEAFCAEYEKKLEDIVYVGKNKKDIQQKEEIFNEENGKIIYKALELNALTLKSHINKFFEDNSESESESKHKNFSELLKDNSMGNMTLLTGPKKDTDSSGQNQSVGNKPYYEKKKIVHKFFKEGQFVPIGTLLVFTDIYTKEQNISNYWLPNSRLEYLNDIIDNISKYLED